MCLQNSTIPVFTWKFTERMFEVSRGKDLRKLNTFLQTPIIFLSKLLSGRKGTKKFNTKKNFANLKPKITLYKPYRIPPNAERMFSKKTKKKKKLLSACNIYLNVNGTITTWHRNDGHENHPFPSQIGQFCGLKLLTWEAWSELTQSVSPLLIYTVVWHCHLYHLLASVHLNARPTARDWAGRMTRIGNNTWRCMRRLVCIMHVCTLSGCKRKYLCHFLLATSYILKTKKKNSPKKQKIGK